MGHGILHAKRINHNMSEVFVERGAQRSKLYVLKTTELLIAAARHSTAMSFDTFYAVLATIGSPASLPATAVDAIAAALGLSFEAA